MNQHPYSYVYLIGIGGIGMSALARYFHKTGANVSGYDLTQSDLCKQLEQEGIAIHYRDDVDAIPQCIVDHPDQSLIIYTPAIPENHSEWNFFRSRPYRIVKRAQALGVIAEDKRVLAVAGTHGKTTTSTLLAHLLTAGEIGCTAFLGGISKNYDTNLLIGDNALLVAEADEFDRSFLQLHPHIAVITSIDADHLDIYGSVDAIVSSFCDFAAQVQPGGTLILKKGLHIPEDRLNACTALILHYSLEEACDFYPTNLQMLENGCYRFDLHLCDTLVPNCEMGVPGWVNVENAIAAAACAFLAGCQPEALRAALKSFCGVKRRFDIRWMGANNIVIDDYAHHPKELSASISAIKKVYPNKKLTGVFQPHLYSRTHDFYREFAASLSLLDECLLLPIYPARELPMEGVDARLIYDRITCPKHLLEKVDCIEWIRRHKPELIACFGAGDIELMLTPIVEAVQ